MPLHNHLQSSFAYHMFMVSFISYLVYDHIQKVACHLPVYQHKFIKPKLCVWGIKHRWKVDLITFWRVSIKELIASDGNHWGDRLYAPESDFLWFNNWNHVLNSPFHVTVQLLSNMSEFSLKTRKSILFVKQCTVTWQTWLTINQLKVVIVIRI